MLFFCCKNYAAFHTYLAQELSKVVATKKIGWVYTMYYQARSQNQNGFIEGSILVLGRWVTERDRLRRWGAKLFSSSNAQRNRCDFLQDLLPAVISSFQRLVPKR